jgi:lysophospholipase L1-like esterase
MTKRHGYALLASIIAVIVAASAGIYVGVSADEGTGSTTATESHTTHNPAAPASVGGWVGAWASSPVGPEPGTAAAGMPNRTVRNVVHANTGGTAARITLSNLYSSRPLTITRATIGLAVSGDSAAVVAETMRQLSFGGSPDVTIPAGRQVMSDVVHIRIPTDTDVVVSTYSPGVSGAVTYHPRGRQLSYAAVGDQTTQAAATPFVQSIDAFRYLTSLDVLSNEAHGTVVAFGDSLTEGAHSTVGANSRWPDLLSDRLHAALAAGDDVPRYSIVNEGIGGNRVLTPASGAGSGTGIALSGTSIPANASGLDRFRRDVLGRTNVRVVILDLGTNDVLHGESADEVLIGLRTLVSEAHAKGLRVVGATLMPFAGCRGYDTAKDAVRHQVNAEIRTGKVYDAYIDFDPAVRDPYGPEHLRPEYDSGDHLHPNDRGYERMAEVFDINALKGAAPAAA